MQRLGKVELEDILNGAAFFASGGRRFPENGRRPDRRDSSARRNSYLLDVEEVSAGPLSLVWNGTESDGH